MAGGLIAALHDVGDDEHHGLFPLGQFRQGLHADGMADGMQGGLIQAVPVLGQTGRVGHRFPGNKNVGGVRQLGAHEAVAVFKIQFHVGTPPQ